MHVVIHAFKERMHVYCQVYSLKEVCLQIRMGSVPLKIREQWNVHTYMSCNQCKNVPDLCKLFGQQRKYCYLTSDINISISARMICYAHVL